ncbi:hypothetical protein GTY65_38645 [Streptomyces sp. SID8379]|uniref:hypothetical protein n=1 Tax=unclassified Streptomyces TaxID=2593676 RepID=UPI00036370DF|nr:MULTISPECIES: hypothetical protein [unclassified Streptomyces]MYW69932.1 hypothetical protein [Streptomyces sp. SID8379]
MKSADAWTISKHALRRAVDMAPDPEEIRAGLLHPQRTFPGCTAGRLYYRRGRITLSVDYASRTVVTVLWTPRNPNDRPTRRGIDRCRDVPQQRRKD